MILPCYFTMVLYSLRCELEEEKSRRLVYNRPGVFAGQELRPFGTQQPPVYPATYMVVPTENYPGQSSGNYPGPPTEVYPNNSGMNSGVYPNSQVYNPAMTQPVNQSTKISYEKA